MSEDKKWIPFYVEKFPKNRNEKRKASAEIKRNTLKVIELELTFIEILFNEEDPTSYLDLYNKFAEYYLRLIEWMDTNRKIRYSKVNDIYFKKLYFPHEIKGQRYE